MQIIWNILFKGHSPYKLAYRIHGILTNIKFFIVSLDLKNRVQKELLHNIFALDKIQKSFPKRKKTVNPDKYII